jgi:hypothetical protein
MEQIQKTKMKTQRRFEKRYEIEAEIGKLKRRIALKLIDAAKNENIADTHSKESRLAKSNGDREFHIEQADLFRKKAIKLRRSVEIANEVKIPALVRTLAAFQTDTLFPNDDQAVVLQR